jgi:hypothetical protein
MHRLDSAATVQKVCFTIPEVAERCTASYSHPHPRAYMHPLPLLPCLQLRVAGKVWRASYSTLR